MRAQAIRKIRFNLSLDNDLADFIKDYASENRTNVAEVITQYILALKRRSEGDPIEAIISDPAFYQALDAVQGRMRDGTEKFYSHSQVFGK